MPAIQVAKTDTFEQQRQKINSLGSTLFSISAGGSDLSTGNLKLGDGTRTVPSLAFVSDPGLGIYKPDVKSFEYVSAGKKIVTYSETKILNYQDVILQQNIISTSGSFITNTGENYDAESYSGIALIGGTGDSAVASITVTEFSGVIDNVGKNYTEGSYDSIPLNGGSSTGTVASFDVAGIVGTITSGGTGYIPTTYENISLINGSGTGAKASIIVSGDTILSGSITTAGSGYTQSEYTAIAFLNTPTNTFVLTSITNPGTPPPNSVYQIGGTTQPTLTLIRGNTYRFNVSSSTVSSHPLIFTTSTDQSLSTQDYIVVSKGFAGTAGSFIDLIIKPTATVGNIKYACSAHSGMGGILNIVSGAVGQYGNNGTATVTVNASGVVSNFAITNSGSGYKQTDILQLYFGDVGGAGSGFQYTLGASSYTGVVSEITITDNGINYVKNDVLSVNSSSIGGQGSGLAFKITSDPGIVANLEFISKGSGYQVQDILQLPEPITNIQTNLKSEVSGISTTLSTSSATITVSSTDGIIAGMEITTDVVSSTGSLTTGTTVSTVNSSTQLTLSQVAATSGAAILNFVSPGTLEQIQLSSVQNIILGSIVAKTSGSGILAANTTVSAINTQTNVITLSDQPVKAGPATLTFTPSFGSTATKFAYKILKLGSIEEFSITNGGNGYSVGDILSVNNKDLAQPITFPVINKNVQRITFVGNIASTVFSVGDTIKPTSGTGIIPISTIYSIKSSGGFIQSMLVDSNNHAAGNIITGESIVTTNYEIATASAIKYRYFINTGSGYVLTPNLTLYVGNKYIFDLSDNSNSSHLFSLSKFRDGIWGPSLIDGVTTTLSSSSTQIIVSSTTGVLPGMIVTVTDGTGELPVTATTVVAVNSGSNSITLDKTPTVSGVATLRFRGTQYNDAVERTDSSLSITITENTPNLYYYCNIQNSTHSDEGGEDNEEALLTINSNNPKVFGSNFSILVNTISRNDIIKGNVKTGEFTALKFTGAEATIATASITGTLTAPTITGTTITATTISSSGNLGLTATAVNITGNFNVGSTIQLVSSTGNITTSGVLRTNGTLNVNDILTVNNNTISTVAGSDIILEPPTGRVAKVNTSTAIIIPSGTSAQRPSGTIAQNGAIRFNTQTGQYEGYSAATTSWSSLGGVRDLDGNTYIAAEASTGANDNILYFFNDTNNTLKLSTSYLDFNTVKKLRSLNTSLPIFTTWFSNTPVTLGSFVKYRNNLYEVTQAGTTGTSGNEPVHTTGAQPNGTSILTWYSSAVAPLVFEEISELQVGPLGNLPLVINSDLRLANNVISTDISDVIIRPNSGKRVSIDAQTSLVIPAGNSNSRGVAAQGSIRYSTTLSSFEGYNGTNWTSLGGVKDVDGNTYIIPETVPGANENILYFFNDGDNTLRLSRTALNFNTLSTITSTSNTLALNAELVTFDNLAASIDNSGTSTFISSTQSNLDLGLSVGLNNKHLIRLNTFGDIIVNKGFGTGTISNLTVLSNELTDFELSDYKLSTTKVTLTRGTTNSDSVVLYSPALHSASKVQIVAKNLTTGDSEFIEYSVIDKGNDIFYTEFGNIKTGIELFSCTFDFTESNSVRVTFTIDSTLLTGTNIQFTVINNIIKR